MGKTCEANRRKLSTRRVSQAEDGYLAHNDTIDFSFSVLELLRQARAINGYSFVREALQEVYELMQKSEHRTLHGFVFDLICSKEEFKDLGPYLPQEIREEYE